MQPWLTPYESVAASEPNEEAKCVCSKEAAAEAAASGAESVKNYLTALVSTTTPDLKTTKVDSDRLFKSSLKNNFLRATDTAWCILFCGCCGQYDLQFKASSKEEALLWAGLEEKQVSTDSVYYNKYKPL